MNSNNNNNKRNNILKNDATVVTGDQNLIEERIAPSFLNNEISIDRDAILKKCGVPTTEKGRKQACKQRKYKNKLARQENIDENEEQEQALVGQKQEVQQFISQGLISSDSSDKYGDYKKAKDEQLIKQRQEQEEKKQKQEEKKQQKLLEKQAKEEEKKKQAEYRAQRNAAKKQRLQAEKEAKKQEKKYVPKKKEQKQTSVFQEVKKCVEQFNEEHKTILQKQQEQKRNFDWGSAQQESPEQMSFDEYKKSKQVKKYIPKKMEQKQEVELPVCEPVGEQIEVIQQQKEEVSIQNCEPVQEQIEIIQQESSQQEFVCEQDQVPIVDEDSEQEIPDFQIEQEQEELQFEVVQEQDSNELNESENENDSNGSNESKCTCPCFCGYRKCAKPQLNFKKAQININDILLQSHLYTHKMKEVPEEIIDIQYNSDKRLSIIDKDGEQYDCQDMPLLNQYEKMEVDLQQRITEHKPSLISKQSVNNYQFDKEIPHIYSCKNGKQVLQKILAENSFKFKYPEIQSIYWDIETFTTPNSDNYMGVPKCDDKEAHISMICTYIPQKQKSVIFVLEYYSYKIQEIKNKLADKIQIDNFELEFIFGSTDSDLSIKFLAWLNSQPLSYLCGFNATQGKCDKFYWPEKAYDINFIINKAKIDKKCFLKNSRNWFNQQEKAISHCSFLPKIMFMDFKQLAQPFVAINETKIKGYKLNDILEFLGINNKIEVNMQAMNNDSNKENSNMSEYIAYCIYDCVCLEQADSKYKMFQTQYMQIQELGLPLFYMNNFSTAQQLTQSILRNLYNSGYGCYYDFLNYKETRPKIGAYTLQVQSEHQYKYYSNGTASDFASQYPSAIKQLNISPENVSQQPTDNCIDINCYSKFEDNKQMVYFKNNKNTVLSDIIDKFMAKKKQAKKDKNTPLEKTSKVIINSVYGLMNQSSSPLYKYECGAAITAFSRFIINYVVDKIKENGGHMLTIDTDGCESLIDQDKLEKITKEIQQEYNYMILENEYNIECMFNNKKKAYLKRKQGSQLEQKGFGSKNNNSHYMRKYIDNVCHKLLDQKLQSFEEIQQFLQQVRNDLGQELKQAIDNNNLEPYALYIKSTKSVNKAGQLTRTGMLEQRFGYNSIYQVIPYNFNEKRVDYNFTLYNRIEDKNKIQFQKWLDLLIKPLTQFFNSKLNKSQEQEQQLKDGEVLIRDSLTQQVQCVKMESLEYMINKTNVYNEKITNKDIKLFMDLDIKKQSDGSLHIIDISKVINIIYEGLNQKPKIHIANGCNSNKQSYHIVVDVLMNINQQKAFAEYINKQYNKQICDTAIYKHNDAQLRLPLQGKIEDDYSYNNDKYLAIQTRSKFLDFVVQYIDNVSINLQNNIAYDDHCVFNMIVNSNQGQALKYLQQLGLSCKINDYQIIVDQKPYKCPVTGNMHESNNLQLQNNQISCYSDRCKKHGKKQKINLPNKEELDKQVGYKQQILKDSTIVNQRFVDYNISESKFTFIKSQMNTGKTYALKQQLEQYSDYNIIAISFRRTFAQDFSSKMGFENYQNIRGDLDLSEHKKIIIQFDSLYRLNLNTSKNNRNIIILDEIESILCQANAFASKTHIKQSTIALINLLQDNYKTVVLDAMLQDKTIQLIQNLSQCDNIQTIHNVYQPKRGNKVKIFKGTSSNGFQSKYIENIITQLDFGQKIVSHCTSQQLAQTVYEQAQKKGYNVKIYHGQDAKIEKCHNDKNMCQAKIQDMENVNENWTQDLLIYTSTITAGISYEQNHYHQQINYFASNTSDSIAFIQGLQRVRNFSDPNITIYLDKAQFYIGNNNPKELSLHEQRQYGSFRHYAIYDEFSLFNQARYNNLINNRCQVLYYLLQDQGYELDIQSYQKENEQTKYELHKKEQDIDFSLQLQNEDASIYLKAKDAQFMAKSTDKQLYSKMALSKLCDIYKIDVQDLNIIEEQQKIQMWKDKTKQILKNQQKYLFEQLNCQDGSFKEIIEKSRQYIRQQQLEIQQYEQLTNKAKQQNDQLFKNAIDAGELLQNITGIQDLTKYIKDHKINVKTSNQKLQLLGYKINTKRSNSIITYKLETI